jgi:hypothetical protein
MPIYVGLVNWTDHGTREFRGSMQHAKSFRDMVTTAGGHETGACASSPRGNTSPLWRFIAGFFGRSLRLSTFALFEQLGGPLMAHAPRAPPPRTRARC